MQDNDLGFSTQEYDYWDDYKNWLRQLKEEVKPMDTTDKTLEQIILKLLNDYPDKEIAVKQIVQLIRGLKNNED